MGFLKRRKRGAAAAPAAGPEVVVQEVRAEDFAFTLYFRAKGSEGVHLEPRPEPAADLSEIVEGLALSTVEVLEPRPVEYSDAAPLLERPHEAAQWLEAHAQSEPVARHALRIFETVGAIDLAVDTLACALLHGDADAHGYPLHDAIVGGAVSRWDEASGDLVVRAVVGWGGKGLAGDTDRIARRLVNTLHARILARRHSGRGWAAGAGAAAPGEGPACPHCGFGLAGINAVFCPQCGQRLRKT